MVSSLGNSGTPYTVRPETKLRTGSSTRFDLYPTKTNLITNNNIQIPPTGYVGLILHSTPVATAS